jgi:hypothetical protein
LAAGKIAPEEMPITTGERQRTDKIRIAPGYDFVQLAAGSQLPRGAYNVDALAKFLGEVDDEGRATDSFKAAFDAMELIDGNGLKEEQVAGLDVWKIDAVVSEARKNIKIAGQHTLA